MKTSQFVLFKPNETYDTDEKLRERLNYLLDKLCIYNRLIEIEEEKRT